MVAKARLNGCSSLSNLTKDLTSIATESNDQKEIFLEDQERIGKLITRKKGSKKEKKNKIFVKSLFNEFHCYTVKNRNTVNSNSNSPISYNNQPRGVCSGSRVSLKRLSAGEEWRLLIHIRTKLMIYSFFRKFKV